MVNKILDNIDTRILRALQRNGKLQNNELANEVGLSNSACLRRVKLLEDSGIIQKYTALLNPKKLNCNFTVYILGSFMDENITMREHFIFEMKLIPQVTECHLMAGDYDFILKLQVADLDEFYACKNKYLTKELGIKNLKSEIILKTVKNTTELPL
ncbi:Lrp/AsnC family transcriptional regulator [Actinobacillus porcinus]|uniref:Leucine-responsive transcriptional regulator n=1 Tax=Actinobacillus porcinus TaxID=51048 RepID=A0ABY6TH34_9PAST|nr:Lrp/AsnC family transcriptional regulator [Actinobacillus porcinus]MCI5764254.1 Lrp/AsnC family transcriptional regulator [Actinobacillus porcinus]MDD7545750.1 Lrp/AsnC family transcriptional regulator [Actinobacillus porcinus]MDY5421972.1 Lrp/AsnC family transcriptional regulator [Actinobacillus porcinus]MDY5848558.1 Lrp/AsnC family transcriptional regulator [Actinobacillus porcinus]VFY92233.1 leucine-responsive transcriptional regulator [Actinobacillus porcinus]